MKTYKFKVELIGTGENVTDAWIDAVDSFNMDPGGAPEPQDCELISDDGEE